MIFFKTCKYSFSGHLETSSRAPEVVLGNIISVVTELYIPSMLESCVLGHKIMISADSVGYFDIGDRFWSKTEVMRLCQFL